LYQEVQRRSQGLEAEVAQRTIELAHALEELKHAQARMVHAERMSALGVLVAGVSHEINNALNFIYGNLPTLRDYVAVFDRLLAAYAARLSDGGAVVLGELSSEVVRARTELPRTAGVISEGAEKARRIVDDLRRFARRDDSARGRVALSDGLEGALQVLLPRLPPGVTVTRRFASDLAPVECDPAQLNQLWMAILLNAAQAVDKVGTIVLTAANSPAGFVTVSVGDSGPGISADLLPRVFEPFVTTRPGEASGLGLAMAREIAERHHGRIEVACPPGGGTVVTVVLPEHAP
jgi:signal transduction histidine kinase